MLKSKAALAGFCSLCSLGLYAQDCHFALRGHVTESDSKEPLAYASVYVREIEKRVLTDEAGYFAIPNLCEKTPYTVEIRHIECAHFTQMVQLIENTLVEFHLVHDAILHEVVVVEKAAPPPPTQAVAAVEKADLESAKGVNLGETLKKLPGVTVLSSGATIAKPVIQGLHSNRIAIVTDGVTLQSQQWGNDHAPEIDPFASDKISVVKGAAGVRYGIGAMAGAVVLEPAPLRKEAGSNGWVHLGVFSNGWGAVLAESVDWKPAKTNWAFRMQGTLKRSGNLRAPDYWLGNTGNQEINASMMAGIQQKKWRHLFSLSQFNQRFAVLRASHSGSLDELKLAIQSDTPRNNINVFSYLIDRPFQQVSHSVAKYQVEYRWNDIWKITGQYNFQFNLREEFDRGRSSITETNLPQVSFRLWSNTLDVALEHRPVHHWQGAMGIQAFQQLNDVSRGGFIPDYLSLGGSVWATERYRRFPMPWEFECGVRYDYRFTHATTNGQGSNNLDKTLQFGNVSGTVGTIYHFNKSLAAKLNTGLAWRPPHVNELFAKGVHHGAGTYEAGNPNLRSEKAWNSNLGVDWNSKGVNLGISLFRNQVKDFIYLDQPLDSFVRTVRGPFPAYFYKQNDAVLKGVDANLALSVTPQFWLEARYSTLFAKRDVILEEAALSHDWLPLMPSDRYQYGVKWQPASPDAFIRLLATTVARQWRIPAEGLNKAAPATFTTLAIDAAHTFSLGKYQLETGVSVQNLTNVSYREYLDLFRYYADAPGINVSIRAKWIF
ncbi:MAG: TonB-dependent receptor [Saprospiraceae bacterium]|nr:TonB-dependent receptor [Saprospiraceae bacterium]